MVLVLGTDNNPIKILTIIQEMVLYQT